MNTSIPPLSTLLLHSHHHHPHHHHRHHHSIATKIPVHTAIPSLAPDTPTPLPTPSHPTPTPTLTHPPSATHPIPIHVSGSAKRNQKPRQHIPTLDLERGCWY